MLWAGIIKNKADLYVLMWKGLYDTLLSRKKKKTHTWTNAYVFVFLKVYSSYEKMYGRREIMSGFSLKISSIQSFSQEIFKGLTVYWCHSRCWRHGSENPVLVGLYFLGEFDKSDQ